MSDIVKVEKEIQHHLVNQENYDRAKEHFELLKKFISEQLKAGEDYGYLIVKDKRTGEERKLSDKPVLFKSGAEKLLALLNLKAEWHITEAEDWEKPLFIYRVKCILKSRKTDTIVAEGHGIASSKEKKYQSDKVDPYDLPNTLLKIAKKRALIDAILQAGAGFFFIQGSEEDEVISEQQIKKLWATATNLKLTKEDVREVITEYGFESTREIPRSKYYEILGKLVEYATEKKAKQEG